MFHVFDKSSRAAQASETTMDIDDPDPSASLYVGILERGTDERIREGGGRALHYVLEYLKDAIDGTNQIRRRQSLQTIDGVTIITCAEDQQDRNAAKYIYSCASVPLACLVHCSELVVKNKRSSMPSTSSYKT